MALCLSVRLSVTSWYCIETAEWTELDFAVTGYPWLVLCCVVREFGYLQKNTGTSLWSMLFSCLYCVLLRHISSASVTVVSFGLLRHPSSRLVQEALFNQQFKVVKLVWYFSKQNFSPVPELKHFSSVHQYWYEFQFDCIICLYCLQCFDSDGWASGRASNL